MDKKEYHIFLLKSIEQEHLFYESAYNESAYKSVHDKEKKGVKALTFCGARNAKKKKKKRFPLYYSTYKNKSQALLKKDL